MVFDKKWHQSSIDNMGAWHKLQEGRYFQYAIHDGEYETAVGLGNEWVGDFDCQNKVGAIIGCGYGRELLYFGDKNTANLIGIDIDENVFNKTRNFLDFHNASFKYQLVTMENLDQILPNSIDFSYCFTVFQHVTQEIVEYYADFTLKTLKSGGVAFHQHFINFTEPTYYMELDKTNEPHHPGYTKAQLYQIYGNYSEVEITVGGPYYFVKAVK